MIQSEEDFPRGGSRIVKQEGVKRKREESLFSFEKPHKSKKSKKQNKVLQVEPLNQNVWQISAQAQGTLSYKKMQDEMNVLCCIRNFTNLTIQVEFPGLTFGTITINNISDTFTKYMTQQINTDTKWDVSGHLKNMISIGQVMPAKIISISHSDKGHEVQATIQPKMIHFHQKHYMFRKGSIIWANVVSELDHGYELTVGINGCRLFLPFKNVDAGKKYEIGQPLYCLIHRVESSNIATTLTVSAKQEHLNTFQLTDFALDNVIPGMKVEFVIDQITSHGINGRVAESFFAYIDQTHFFNKVHKNKLIEGGLISAYVLFVEPVTKVIYLTLRGLDHLNSPQFKLGTVMAARIQSTNAGGLCVRLGEKNSGFITNKRLLKTLPQEAKLDVAEAVRKKYPPGSVHKCRILDYNYMQDMYICTFEKELIKEKIFSVQDLHVGQKVTVKVDKVAANGLIVKAGHVQGFVSNLHLSNVAYSEGIKGKYKVGMEVQARVLNITTEESVFFTLKPRLLEVEDCLSEVNNTVLRNSQNSHIGFVVQTKISGALIAFYGNVRGWISNKVLNASNSERYSDPRDYFFLGQVVNVWISGVKNNKLQLSLNSPASKRKIKFGTNVCGTVTEIHSNGIDVEVGENRLEGTVPVAHLSDDVYVCSVLHKQYKPGDKITDLLCINNEGTTSILSRRESIAHQEKLFRIWKVSELEKGKTLRCSFEERDVTGIYVSAPVKDINKVFIEVENQDTLPHFVPQQLVKAKVSSVDSTNKKLTLVHDVPKKNTNLILNNLSKTIEEIEHVVQLATEKGCELTDYKIGERVDCVLTEILANGDCCVSLPNGASGIIPKHLKPMPCEVGSTVEGVVLEYNFLEDCILLCGRKSIYQKINKVQDGFISKALNTSCMAKILLHTECYVVGILKDNKYNRQLIYLPLLFDESEKLYEQPMKVVVCRKNNTRLLGLYKQYAQKERLNKREKSKKTNKKLQIESEEVSSGEDELPDKDEMKIEKHFIEEDDDEDEDTSFNDSTQEIINEPILSGTSSFFSNENPMQDADSSDEEESKQHENKKRPKLSAKEEIAKEDERIAAIEKQLLDTKAVPQNAEQFDRLLLGNPNSSELWLKYIAMHVAATELEKARAVGKRALTTIDATLSKEKFNVWIAMLNLENMYGTKESFEKLFDEAVRCNDDVDVYLTVIKILAAAGKIPEMEHKIRKLRNKEKQSVKMWLEVGQVYYSLKMFREARNVKEAALRSILDNKNQFNIIVRFGIMEFQLGDLEQAIAHFEAILRAYPNKANIWILYIDQLTKQNQIDNARKILTRAVNQKLSVRTMKTFFQKFISFEEQHGTPEAVNKVKALAKDYITTVGKAL